MCWEQLVTEVREGDIFYIIDILDMLILDMLILDMLILDMLIHDVQYMIYIAAYYFLLYNLPTL